MIEIDQNVCESGGGGSAVQWVVGNQTVVSSEWSAKTTERGERRQSEIDQESKRCGTRRAKRGSRRIAEDELRFHTKAN